MGSIPLPNTECLPQVPKPEHSGTNLRAPESWLGWGLLGHSPEGLCPQAAAQEEPEKSKILRENTQMLSLQSPPSI